MSDGNENRSGKKPGAVLIGFLVLLVGEVLILANSGVTLPTILPEPVSTYAENVDRLFFVILWIVGFFFVLTQALLVYFLVKYRAREGGKARHTHGSHALELVWTFVPGVILFCLAVFQTGTWGMIKFGGNIEEKAADPRAVHVQVFGKQFEWHFRYAGNDGEFGTQDDVIKVAEMHAPVDRPVIVHLQTLDVLHSFWLPNVLLKQDLMPGRTILQWFEITKQGKFPIVCAELCGNMHTAMKGALIVESDDAFDAWLEKQGKLTFPHEPERHDVWKFWREEP
jgi:cytochrome c oxidase subunit 2